MPERQPGDPGYYSPTGRKPLPSAREIEDSMLENQMKVVSLKRQVRQMKVIAFLFFVIAAGTMVVLLIFHSPFRQLPGSRSGGIITPEAPATYYYSYGTASSYEEDILANTEPGAESQMVDQVSPVEHEGADSPVPGEYWITCYSAYEGFPETNQVARGGSVRLWVDLALAGGYDGICAVSPGTPWYNRIRDEIPPILKVEATGLWDPKPYPDAEGYWRVESLTLMAVDRMATRINRGVDIWVPWNAGHDGPQWRVKGTVTEINTN